MKRKLLTALQPDGRCDNTAIHTSQKNKYNCPCASQKACRRPHAPEVSIISETLHHGYTKYVNPGTRHDWIK